MIHPKTYMIMAVSAIILSIIVLIIVFIYPFLVTFSNKEILNSNRLILGGIAFLDVIFLLCLFVITSAFTNKPSNNWLFIPLILTTLVIFQIINFTGGLMHTPFIGLYPALLTITLLIYERLPVILFTFLLIVLSLIGNLFIEQAQLHCEPTTLPSYYNWLYLIINCIIIILIGLVDFASKYPERVPFLRRFYATT